MARIKNSEDFVKKSILMFAKTVRNEEEYDKFLQNANGVFNTYPLTEDDKEELKIITGDDDVDCMSILALENLRQMVQTGKPNDISKYCIPECLKTSLVMTINARSLQNFLELRTSKHALKEIQDLARAMFEVLPSDHKFLFRSLLNDV